MTDKIKLIFIPYLLSLVGLIICYTFLNWLIFIELKLFNLSDKKQIPQANPTLFCI